MGYTITYDRHSHQFADARRNYTVFTRRQGADGHFAGTHIDWADRDRVHVHEAVLFHNRRHVPTWPRNAPQVRRVLLVYLRRRVMGNRKLAPPAGATEFEQVAFWENQERRRVPKLIETLDRLCREYVERKKAAGSAAATDQRLRVLETEIKSIDSTLILIRDGVAAKAARCIYLFFLCGWDSVSTGAELKLSPAAVRMMTCRMNRIARELGYE